VKIYVGNLSKQVTDEQLNELALPYGAVVSANVAMDKAKGESRGFGFVEFSDPSAATAAIRGLNGRDVNGQTIKVNESKPKAPRAEAASTN